MLKGLKKWMSRHRVAFEAPPNSKARRISSKNEDTGSNPDDIRFHHANSDRSRDTRCVQGVTITETVNFELPIEPQLSTPERQRILHPIREEDFDSHIDQKECTDSGKGFTPTHSEHGEPTSPAESLDVRNGDRRSLPSERKETGTEASISQLTSLEEFGTPAAEFPEVDLGVGRDASMQSEEGQVLDRDRPRNPEAPSLLTTPIRKKSSNTPRRQTSKTISPPTPSSSDASSFVARDEPDKPDEDNQGSILEPTIAPPPPAPPPVSSCIANGTWLIPIPILAMPSPSAFEYQFGGLLGEGGFGKVMLALHLTSHKQYAMKLIQLKRIRGYREALSVANEIKVLQTLHHAGELEMPFLARPAPIKDWIWQFQGHVHIVMVRLHFSFVPNHSDRLCIELLPRW